MTKVEEDKRRHIQRLFWSSRIFLQPLLTPCLLTFGQSKNTRPKVEGHCILQGKGHGYRRWWRMGLWFGLFATTLSCFPLQAFLHLLYGFLPIQILHLSLPLRLRLDDLDSIGDHFSLYDHPRPYCWLPSFLLLHLLFECYFIADCPIRQWGTKEGYLFYNLTESDRS